MKPKKINLMDLPSIQNTIIEKHRAFLDNYSFEIDKVAADHRAFSELIFARLFRVLITFKEASIIDEVNIINKHPLQGARILKNRLNNYVEIVTNGKGIVLQGFGYVFDDFQSDITFPKVKIDDVRGEEYDWADFSMKLLDYIHVVIYQRQEACEAKLDNVLR